MLYIHEPSRIGSQHGKEVMLQVLDKIARADLGKRIYALFPSHPLNRLPEMPLREMDRGHGGLIRGWGLQFGSLRRMVACDPLYRIACRAAQGRSMLNELRRINLYLIVRFFMAELTSRDIAELGVYRGGSCFFLATLLNELYPGAKVFALDTFEGMPETKPGLDLHVSGDFSDVSLVEIQKSAAERGIRNIEYIKGDVRDTLRTFSAPLGLAHIDLDIYEPIVIAQDAMWKRLVPGGYLVYDDATVSSCLGATRAVEDFVMAYSVHSDQIYPHYVFRKERLD